MRSVGRLVRVVLVLLLLAAAAVAWHRPLLRAAGRCLLVDDGPAPADAIVVLSGSFPDRILHGVDLYTRGFAPLLLTTREPEVPGLGELRARGLSVPERYQQTLTVAEQLGVPRDAIATVEERSGSTIEELSAVVRELRRRRVRSVLLVTSKTHGRRAALTFRALDRGAVGVRICPTPYDPFPADDWWRDRAFARRLVTEYAKLAYFQLVDRWRAQAIGEEGGAP